MTEDFITALVAKIGQSVTAYYEEAPTSATYPYAVVSASVTPLDFGDQIDVTVTHWHTEGVGHAVAIEAQCDTVRQALDGASINTLGEFNSYVRFDSQRPVADAIQDFIVRQQDYYARVFYLGGS